MFGLLGKSLGHSFSKDYFTKKFSELNLNYSYQNIELENIADIIPFVKEIKNLKGFNVTVPYKEGIIPFLDFIDDTAKEVGAVNTVKVENGMLKGKVTSVVFKGVHYEIEVKESGRVWIIHSTQNAQVGSELGLDIYPEDIHIMRKVRD
jgi:shikimate 5-dehydrogenase